MHGHLTRRTPWIGSVENVQLAHSMWAWVATSPLVPTQGLIVHIAFEYNPVLTRADLHQHQPNKTAKIHIIIEQINGELVWHAVHKELDWQASGKGVSHFLCSTS